MKKNKQTRELQWMYLNGKDTCSFKSQKINCEINHIFKNE